MSADAPKCRSCNGWGIEPDRHPLTLCGTCGGTGKPAKQQHVLSAVEGGRVDG
jgi:DnaJ-class molecular chaperone